MNNKTIQRVILLGTIAIIGILGIQSYWIVNTWNLRSSEFDQKVQVSLRRVAYDLAELNGTVLPSEDLVRQMSTDYYLVNINNLFSSTDLEFFLKKELEALNIQDDFDYYIYDCGSDEMVFSGYVDYGKSRSEDVEMQMPKSSDLIYYFGVRFPNRRGFILNTLWLAFLFSFLLLLAISFFAYSMFIILKQKRLADLQKDFINNMTHEFKTPISTIKISNDVFLSDPEIQKNKRLYQYANIINEQNERLTAHVDKVLNVARIEQDTLTLNHEMLDLLDVVQKSIKTLNPKLEQREGTLNLQTSMSEIPIRGDAFHLQNVFVNLIDNAIKYTKVNPVINIAINSQGGFHVVEIEDNGIGFKEEQKKFLFEKFYRVPTGNVHDVKGFGLGLYYVKHICDLHKWSIDIVSPSTGGSIIKIKIPKK
ncbi:MAG: HAMP domain-containing histidine kinase [Bacteroidia bacterium]|nr:HAMP domain-containing histidine kinase [Bacteroidia bacterium]